MQVKSIAECSKNNSAIFSTFIKQPFVFKIFVLSIFEWLLKTGFTVVGIQLLHTFLCNSQNPELLWMTWCTVAQGRRPRHPQHRGGDSFDCYTEKYRIVVLLPNSEQYKIISYGMRISMRVRFFYIERHSLTMADMRYDLATLNSQ